MSVFHWIGTASSDCDCGTGQRFATRISTYRHCHRIGGSTEENDFAVLLGTYLLSKTLHWYFGQ